MPEETLEDQWRVSVVFPPQAELSGPGEPLREGGRAVLNCAARANPRPYDYHWRRCSILQHYL